MLICTYQLSTKGVFMQNEARINLRTTSDRKALIAKAAAYSGTSLSTFLLQTAEARARIVLKEQEELHLTVRDWESFLNTLDEEENDPKPRPRLRALIDEYAGDHEL